MVGSDNAAHWITEGEKWLRTRRDGVAETCFRKCPVDLVGKLAIRYAVGLAEAILQQEPDETRARQAYNLLVRGFIPPRGCPHIVRALRGRLLKLAAGPVPRLPIAFWNWPI